MIKKITKKQIVNKKNIFERLSTKENIVIFSFVLVILIFMSLVIKSYVKYDQINYDKVSFNSLKLFSNKINDRQTYWILNDIVDRFLNSNLTQDDNNKSKYCIEDYYKTLFNDYKVYLGKKEYKKLASKIILNYKDNYDNKFNLNNKVPIKNVYSINDYKDFYLVELNTKNESYIGVKLYKNVDEYSFFYFYCEEE